jgi:murein DD-endopeptidase MepM/ murein hydrolase activator NlpD
MNKKTILIVPPRGVSQKAFKIRPSMAVVLVVVILVGFTGFFLPYRTVTDNVAEQNQRKNLTEQNRALLQKVLSTLRLLKDVKVQVGRLEDKQAGVIVLSGSEIKQDAHVKLPEADLSKLSSDELLGRVEKIEAQLIPFRSLSSESGNVFNLVPVLRPVCSPASISRGYGVTLDPFSGKQRSHNGVDFVAEPGTPVIATASGIVLRIEKHPIWGNKVVIAHDNHYLTGYSHLGIIKTAQGRRVRRGEVIGLIGLSGLSSGPHVHYEVWHNGKNDDPEKYFFPDQLVSK